MIGHGWFGRLGGALLCVSCGGGAAGVHAGAGGGSGMAMGGGAGADSGPKAGDSCSCIEKSRGSLECTAGQACQCVCRQVDCVTEGGLSGTTSCQDAKCDACEAPPAGPRSSTLVLKETADAELMAADETTYVRFRGFPSMGHYETSGNFIQTSVYLDAVTWGHMKDFLVADDGSLYIASTADGFVTTKKTVVVHAASDGKTLMATLGPDDVASIDNLTRAPNGKIYAQATTADGALFVSPLDVDGNLGERTPVVGFGTLVRSFAANDQGDFVFAGAKSSFAPYSSRIATLPAGTTTLADLYDASHDLVEKVVPDPGGGWWFSSGNVDQKAQTWVATLYHADAKGGLSKAGELTSSLGAVDQFTELATGFALLSDSALLMNVNPTTHQLQSVGRFADGKLIQAVNAENAYLISAAGKQWATILTRFPGYSDGPGIVQIKFVARRSAN